MITTALPTIVIPFKGQEQLSQQPIVTLEPRYGLLGHEVHGSMSEDKQTFTDPETGQEIESTWLARWGSVLFSGTVVLVFSLLVYVLYRLPTSGLYTGLLLALLAVPHIVQRVRQLVFHMETARHNRITRWAHDGIARHQHRRRQRILRSRNDQDVPDTAISRAQPPGTPTAD